MLQVLSFYFGLCSWQLSSLLPSSVAALFIALLLQFVFVRKLHFSAFYISINFPRCAAAVAVAVAAAFYAAILA